jgi:hypothetical protein
MMAFGTSVRTGLMLIISYGMSCIPDDLFTVKHVRQYVTQHNSFLYGVIFHD